MKISDIIKLKVTRIDQNNFKKISFGVALGAYNQSRPRLNVQKVASGGGFQLQKWPLSCPYVN